MSSLASQAGSLALSGAGTLISYGSWGALKTISLGGWALQVGAEYVVDNGPSALSYCWEKASKYGAPVAQTGLGYVGSALHTVKDNISPELIAGAGIVVGVAAGVLGVTALCVHKIRRGFSLREKVVYVGIILEGGSRMLSGKGFITEAVKTVPSVVTEKLIGNVGVVSFGAFCAYQAVTASSPQQRSFSAIGAVVVAYLLLN